MSDRGALGVYFRTNAIPILYGLHVINAVFLMETNAANNGIGEKCVAALMPLIGYFLYKKLSHVAGMSMNLFYVTWLSFMTVLRCIVSYKMILFKIEMGQIGGTLQQEAGSIFYKALARLVLLYVPNYFDAVVVSIITVLMFREYRKRVT